MRVFCRHTTGPLPGLREMLGTEDVFPGGRVPPGFPHVQLRWHTANIVLERMTDTYVLYREESACEPSATPTA